MRLTEEQYKTLSQYESQFKTAINAKWARFPGTAALHEIHRIQREVTGRSTSLNTSCTSCVLRLLTDMGNIYLADKTERESRVRVIPADAATQEKVEVKTEKKRGRKPKEQK